jgi:uncharacterized protein YdeI (YjbR/CyaY-like superfamily)
MQPSGLAQVAAARQDGRWDKSYAGRSEMVIPDDFLSTLERNADAKAFFGTPDRPNRFVIYLRLQTAKRPKTRARRLDVILEKLGRRVTLS